MGVLDIVPVSRNLQTLGLSLPLNWPGWRVDRRQRS